MAAGSQRYWDGTSWTEHRAPGGTPEKPVPFAEQFPMWGKVMIVCVCAGLALWISTGLACEAVVDGVEEAREESKAEAMNPEGRITREQYDSIVVGTAQVSVEEAFGPPNEVESSSDDELFGKQECISYEELGDDSPLLPTTFEFCFDDGKLDRKSSRW